MAMTPDLSLLKRVLSVGAAFGTATFSTVGLATVGLSTVGVTSAVASPNYFDCAADMIASGVSSADAISACAGARYPGDLGACVVDVNELTGLTANSALLVCSRTRRPMEVANCTIDIHNALFDSPSTKVLENCGRSLMPNRYGSCVVDIVDATEISTDEALGQCIRAGFRPWQLMPRG